ncbi:MAG: hypothetical protein OQK93_03170 [Gammaproteobacteria bacterium]|jgi:hypothetical protein|nr:hypothetical protein [Gammaproteobacteria bacterium]
MGWLDKSISKQRSFIEGLLLDPLSKLADISAANWGDRNKLDQELKAYLQKKSDHRCRLLYAIDRNGVQYSSNISDVMVDETIIGQDLSHRPYLKSIDSGSETQLLLSDVYIDKQTRKPCITVLHDIRSNDEVIGYIAADFGLRDLPLKNVNDLQSYEWRQIKGDPSIRGTMFQQTRVRSAMDEHIDEVLDVVESLMTEQGVFHAKLHFSSSRATLWSYSDPYRYRLHVLDEIINPKVCLVYEKMPYPERAMVTAGMVHNVLKAFKLLRDADETIYLRAASLNIMNGLVGLNFSCDGSHYMPANEFLDKDLKFWFGEEAVCVNA